MTRTTTPEMSREQHALIIARGIKLDGGLFDPLTLEGLLVIERQLNELMEQTNFEYVVVPVGQPFGGPKRLMALPREDVDAAHRAYQKGLRGVSPEIGRVYDLSAERERLENSRPSFNPDHYPPEFLEFLRSAFGKSRR